MIVSLRSDQVKLGEVYIAYSARSRKLSSNGTRGVFVKVLGKKDDNISVEVSGFERPMTIRNLDNRLDAWMVDVSEEIEGIITEGLNPAWPRSFEKSRGKTGKLRPFSTVRRDDEEVTYTVLIGEDKNRMMRIDWCKPLTDVGSVVVPFQRHDEFLKKEAELARKATEERIAARQAEAVKLMRGKLDGSKDKLLAWLLPIRDIIAKEYHKRENKGLCNHARIFVKGEWEETPEDKVNIKFSFTAPCASFMSNRVDENCIAVWADHNKDHDNIKGVKEQHQRVWIDYLINHSGLSRAYLNTSVDDVLENGYLIDASLPSRFVHAAVTAPRQCWEYASKGMLFGSLLDAGVTNHFAWFAAQCASGNYKNGFKTNTKHGTHSFMCQSHMSDKTLLNFLRGIPKAEYSPYTNDHNYNGCSAQWGGSQGERTFYDALMCIGSKTTSGVGFGASRKCYSIDEIADMVQQAGEKWAEKMGVDPVTLKDNK